jgi:NADH-quinone oxidoreductase subunit N
MGKYFLFAAAVDKGLVLLAAAGALNSAISLFYYFRIGKAMFLEDQVPAPADAALQAPERVSRSVTIVLAISAAALLLIGLLPGLLTAPAASAVLGR